MFRKYKNLSLSETKTYRYIISGGGTGGHIFPAIAIANGILEQDPDADILFVGAKGKMEMQKVPEAGYPIIGLWISGLQRKISVRNFLFPLKVMVSILRSKRILSKHKPDAVIGVGGYASGPLLYAAVLRKIPTLIQEQNSYPGITNKILGSRVNKICVAYDNMEKFFPKKKVVLTGNPVRKTMMQQNADRSAALRHFNLDSDKPTLLIMGGSLGARTINESIEKDLTKLIDHGIQVIWQTGKFYYDGIIERVPEELKNKCTIVAFIKEMNLAYTAADIVISRAGALSISELCLVDKPVIFVPSPNVAEDHQTKNAMALVEKDAALLVKDKDARNTLVDQAVELIKDQDRRELLAKNIGQMAKPDAVEDIIKEISKIIK